MGLPDPVPLGVSGRLNAPPAFVDAAFKKRKAPVDVLRDDNARIAYLAKRIDDALDRPLINPGTGALARTMLGLFPEPAVVLAGFAEKALETLRDDSRHDRMAVVQEGVPAVVWFVCWSGSHFEVQTLRYGTYLGALASTASRIVESRGPLAGFLEIDAFVRENVDPKDPGRPLADAFQIDVEYSFLPGNFLKYPGGVPNPLPNLVMLNRSLCTAEEIQAIEEKMR